MERENRSRQEEYALAGLIVVVGGILGAIGAFAELNILSSNMLDVDTAILAGGSTLVGASLILNGIIRFLTIGRRIPKNGGK